MQGEIFGFWEDQSEARADLEKSKKFAGASLFSVCR